jgi:hypothetical protein
VLTAFDEVLGPGEVVILSQTVLKVCLFDHALFNCARDQISEILMGQTREHGKLILDWLFGCTRVDTSSICSFFQVADREGVY